MTDVGVFARAWFAGDRRHAPNPVFVKARGAKPAGLEDWIEHVSARPDIAWSTSIQVREIKDATPGLFKKIEAAHGVSSDKAIDIFDEYLVSVCPRCDAQLTGGQLITAAGHQSAGGVMGVGESFVRLRRGTCTQCDSSRLVLYWLGEVPPPSSTDVADDVPLPGGLVLALSLIGLFVSLVIIGALFD